MEGLGALILFCFAITFGPPAIFLIVGIAKRNTDRRLSNVLLIIGTAWLIIGGGTCLSIWAGA